MRRGRTVSQERETLTD